MPGIFLILVAPFLLGACSSRGDLVDRSEDYQGPRTAAVTPVSDGRPRRGPSGELLRADIQHSIQHRLDQSGIFAGVVALDRTDEENEAEIIIEPALITLGGDGDDVGLRVRVTEKTRRRVVLDSRYEGNGRADTLEVAIQELEEALEDRYER